MCTSIANKQPLHAHLNYLVQKCKFILPKRFPPPMIFCTIRLINCNTIRDFSIVTMPKPIFIEPCPKFLRTFATYQTNYILKIYHLDFLS